MKTCMQKTLLFLILLLPFMAFADSVSLDNPLPDNSVYHIESNWRDQHGEVFNITELKDSVRIVAFVYTCCEHTCPVIITRIKSIMRSLTKDSQDRTIVTLVTLDPLRDTVERVREYMKNQHLDNQNWQILVGSPDNVLTLSALFDVRYKPMGESDIAHSNTITLVDQRGVIRKQLKGLGQSPDEMIEMIEELNQPSPP